MNRYETTHVYALLREAKNGSTAARDRLVDENMKLVYSIASRFYGRGVDKEDLHQLGALGLLAAIDRFDISMGTRFSTYAVPIIAGEIKRFFRDDGMIKVSRSMKTLAFRAAQLSEQICARQGRMPTISELAEALHVSREELAQAEEALSPVSSFSAVLGDSSKTLAETLPAPDGSVSLLERLDMQEAIASLPAREQTIVRMRYIGEKTQADVAKKLGISQVQVSRLEKKILEQLRNQLKLQENSPISAENY